ncbi:MAG TPA: ribosome small subunit-dependent GTPase A [Legionellales bacterium]|jgi:ribosome biogenesis GTPase|nr:ribosome small subunit-dependent GTPase A [Legionellales bacterium]
MSKKKLTKQQKMRIERKHQSLEEHTLLKGLVITRGKNQALIESFEDQQQMLCNIRPDIHSLVVGDRVLWQKVSDEQGVVESVLARQSELGRPLRYQHYKILAANITQMIIVVAPKPIFSELLIDSYLVVAALMNIQVSLIFNKADLDDAAQSLEKSLRQTYAPLVDHFIIHSQVSPNQVGIEKILENQTSVFVGQSGVGKSTIIQWLLPHQSIMTSPLSSTHEFGQHTTSNAYYFHLPHSGAIIDSPGVRSFGLWKVTPQDLIWGFKEFRPFIGLCKFRDCDHIQSPHCALRKAVEDKSVSELRYQNYIKLLEQTK